MIVISLLPLCSSSSIVVLVIFFSASVRPDDASSQGGRLLPYQTLYVNGVDAYMNERWSECVTLVTRAISDYKLYRSQLNSCRLGCRKAGRLNVDETNFLDNAYLEAAREQSTCIKNCTDEAFPGRRLYKDFSPKLKEVELHFQNSDPYDYLQMCAFKGQQYELAYSAAFTFAIARPGHPHATYNLEFYKKVAGDRMELFKNLEPKLHQTLRQEAVETYDEEQWQTAVERFEASLAAYFEADSECHLECDAYLDEARFSEFHRKVSEAKFKEEARFYLANHWLKLLGCRESCMRKLATVDGTPLERFFLDHFHYLQYCYYKVGNAAMAARNVATYLLFNPNDPNQQYNKIFYVQQVLAKDSDFVPREDALKFHERKMSEARLKKAAEEEFVLHRGKRSIKPFTYNSSEVYGPVTNESTAAFETFLASIGSSVITHLTGQRRVVADGLVSPQECQRLIELADIGHSEKINKITVSKAAEMVRDGKASSAQVSSLMHVSDKVRVFLEKFHNLKVPLLFQRTQLTYREDERDSTLGNLTLDKLDACHLDVTNFCFGPNGRDFVAYIHLEVDGGDGTKTSFHFLDKVGQTSRPGIELERGRMVALAMDDAHHLDRVTSGRSYALVVWFTLSPTDQELDHAEARTILRIVEGGAARASKISLASLDFMKSKKYSLSLDEEDLNGPERFAADGVATEEECRALIKLTNSFGSVGSGYSSGFSHTEHESFSGVTVNAISELAVERKVSHEDVQLYLRLSNDMRELTQRLLVGDRPLYFSFTHLVCRTALNDENLDRTDLSHPIHSDNCIIQDDNTCKKVRPAYTERDYSAILYLNDDFFGGDFFFAHQNMSVQSRVKPKCGRVVSFNSSHYHGVKPVLSGQRCAVAIWFTLDRNFDEESHPVAREILERLREDEQRWKQHPGGDHLHVDL